MFENEELISKKQLLRVARISYGTLYRWKRMKLIPESWFIHKATVTGQETFLPRDRVLARIERIQDLKGELTVEQLQEIFSPNVKSFLIPVDDFVKLNLVSKIFPYYKLSGYLDAEDAGLFGITNNSLPLSFSLWYLAILVFILLLIAYDGFVRRDIQ